MSPASCKKFKRGDSIFVSYLGLNSLHFNSSILLTPGVHNSKTLLHMLLHGTVNSVLSQTLQREAIPFNIAGEFCRFGDKS